MRLTAKLSFLAALALSLVSHTFAAGPVTGTTAGALRNVRYAYPGMHLYNLKVATPAGSDIMVSPGLYSIGVTNLFKHNVRWFFMPGSVISNTAGFHPTWNNSATGETGPIDAEVWGAGTFIDTGGAPVGALFEGLLLVTNPASRIKFQCKALVGAGASVPFAAICIRGCLRVDLDVDEIACPDANIGYYWENGDVYGRIDINDTDSSPPYWGAGNAPANSYIRGRFWTARYPVLFHAATHAQNKAWFDIDELAGQAITGVNGAGVHIEGGKVYLTYKKMGGHPADASGGLALVQQTGGELWLNGQKQTITNNLSFLNQSGGWNEIMNNHYEDVGAGAQTRGFNWQLTAGTNNFLGGVASTLWGPGYKHSGGEMYMRDVKLNTASTLQGSNVCYWGIGAVTGLVENCTFIPGSLFSVSNSTATDLIVYGTGGLRTRSNLTVTVTARAGTVTVDANVYR